MCRNSCLCRKRKFGHHIADLRWLLRILLCIIWWALLPLSLLITSWRSSFTQIIRDLGQLCPLIVVFGRRLLCMRGIVNLTSFKLFAGIICFIETEFRYRQGLLSLTTWSVAAQRDLIRFFSVLILHWLWATLLPVAMLLIFSRIFESHVLFFEHDRVNIFIR